MLDFDWSLLSNRIDVSLVMNNSDKEVTGSFWQGQGRVGFLF